MERVFFWVKEIQQEQHVQSRWIYLDQALIPVKTDWKVYLKDSQFRAFGHDYSEGLSNISSKKKKRDVRIAISWVA